MVGLVRCRDKEIGDNGRGNSEYKGEIIWFFGDCLIIKGI